MLKLIFGAVLFAVNILDWRYGHACIGPMGHRSGVISVGQIGYGSDTAANNASLYNGRFGPAKTNNDDNP